MLKRILCAQRHVVYNRPTLYKNGKFYFSTAAESKKKQGTDDDFLTRHGGKIFFGSISLVAGALKSCALRMLLMTF